LSDNGKPIGVAAAANGNLYVTACDSNNVHCFTPDGTHKGIMLKKEDRLNRPYAIDFSKKSSKVFMVNYLEESVLRFFFNWKLRNYASLFGFKYNQLRQDVM
jgi:DNA-binding beta-propeller fold protein YncE